jgi:ATP-dependent Clp protease protease subunit
MFEAEAKKTMAEARAFSASAKLVEIDLAVKQHEDRLWRTNDDFHHVYRFTEQVSGTTVARCIAQFEQWDRTADDPLDVDLIIYSPGGGVTDGLALWDYLTEFKGKGHKLTTTARGYAASMGGILLQAGHERLMGREAFLLIHEGSGGAIGTAGEVEDLVEFWKKMRIRLADILAERSVMSRKQIERKWARTDWWLDSAEALKLGFVDGVV